jgi:hypothetical protein
MGMEKVGDFNRVLGQPHVNIGGKYDEIISGDDESF